MSNIKKHSPPAVNFKLNEFWNIVYLENCKLLQWFKNNNNDPTQPIPILFVTCNAHEIQLQINSTLNTQGTFYMPRVAHNPVMYFERHKVILIHFKAIQKTLQSLR